MIKRQYGTFDILPDEMNTWRFIEESARKTAALYGFREIRFPTFEATELFARGVGDTTDIVNKEMYTFDDRSKRSLTLRPEGTACVVRSIIENGLATAAMPLKLFYIANFFRHEKAQKGRSREFFQFGVELFGAESPEADATVIAVAASLFRELGIKNVALHINSIGCGCSAEYKEALVKYFTAHIASLCDTCKERLKTNPMRILDCKCESCASLAADAPKTIDYLCEDCKNHFTSLCALLDSFGIKYTVDPKIVRGLDYYTGTVFEFINEGIGAQSTICGGGRYNGLVEELDGPALSGVGFGMGITRLISAMELNGVTAPAEEKLQVYLAPVGDLAKPKLALLAEQLRSMGIRAESDIVGRSVKAQMKYADKTGALYSVVAGDNELESGKATLKSMTGGESFELELTAEAIAEKINNAF